MEVAGSLSALLLVEVLFEGLFCGFEGDDEFGVVFDGVFHGAALAAGLEAACAEGLVEFVFVGQGDFSGEEFL